MTNPWNNLSPNWRFCFIWAAVVVLMLMFVSTCTGCAALQANPKAGEDQKITTSQPVESVNQAGAVNAAAQVDTDVGGVTGINIQQAMPLGFVIVLVMVVGLSHRREMVRIKRNGGGSK